MPIHYLNTDLDLVADHDLTALVEALEARGLVAVHHVELDEGFRAGFELPSDHAEPATTIAGLLAVAEALDADARARWDACRVREFNLGYGCGDRPWGFHQRLDPSLLARIAALRAGLRITIYPTDSTEISEISGVADGSIGGVSDQAAAVP